MVIITGASRGIGKFLFDKFSEQGNEVIVTYHLTKVEQSKPHTMYQVDITYYKHVNDFFSKIEDRMHEIILINSAGVNYSGFAHQANID